MNDERTITELEFSVNLTLPQAAEKLGVSLATARRLVRSGKLRAVKVQTEERTRWEVPPDALEEFRLNPDGERQFSESSEPEFTVHEPQFNQAERTSKGADSAIGIHPALIEAHLEALKLVSTLQEKFEAAQRRAEQAERALMPLAHQLDQYQRCLAENAESLAEERSRRLELEFKVMESSLNSSSPEVELEFPDVAPKVDTPQRRRGWGQRFKVWLLGEKTG
jgi:excisionase family DNA binding protein